MKKYFALLIILITKSTIAQIEFQDNVVTDGGYPADGVNSALTADIDGDGDLDVISGSENDNKIARYENTDGNGLFGGQQIIATNAHGAQSVYSTDIDGDGDIDILSASSKDNKIAWYENINGKGFFGDQQIITTNASYAWDVYASDIDGDGDIDVLSASIADDKIAWYENTDGKGKFGAQQIITTYANGALSVYSTDIDGDGDMDVVSASRNDDEIAWYENTNGKGVFGNQQIISTNVNLVQSIFAADIDGDGDMDVLSASAHDFKIAWYENMDGNGTFGDQKIIAKGSHSQRSVYTEDMDGDGDMDVISSLGWHENVDGKGTFSFHQINNAFNEDSVYASDIDGDGNPDLISARNDIDQITWYKNSDGLGDFIFVQHLSSIAYNAISAFVADLDNDGKVDIVSSSINKVAWHKNIDGLGNFGIHETIHNVGTYSFNGMDMDNDGDIDIVSGEYGAINWFENIDGKGEFNLHSTITSDVEYIFSIFIADIDNDGDPDVLSASYNDEKIAWYENIDGKGNFGPQNILTTTGGSKTSVVAADLDGDNDLDIIFSTSKKVAWLKNIDGKGNFESSENLIENADLDRVSELKVSDLDGDGYLDVLYNYITAYNKITWRKNVDGKGNFGNRITITGNYNNYLYSYLSDLDNDSDLDLIYASSEFDKIYYRENIGGSFSNKYLISNVESPSSLYASDIDNDGDMDILSTSFDNPKAIWHENLISSPLGLNNNFISKFYLFPNPTKNVLNLQSKTQIKEINIYNNLGQVILSRLNKTFIDVSTLATGIYFIKIKDYSGNVETKKIIKE